MNQIANQFQSLELVPTTSTAYQKARRLTSTGKEESFEQIFAEKKQQSSEVTFSKHANQRLMNRNMSLSKEQLARLNSGVEQARAKHIKESLILVDNMSFIVNVSSNTVVTAMNQEEEQQIFTNIDGAVIS